MKSGIITTTLLLLLTLTGCSPSITTLTDMRSITGDQKARSEQRELLREFAKGGQSAVWRAEAMNTLAFLDFEFMQGTHHPQMHKRLIDLLKSEYIKPNVAPETSQEERYRLRAWSIHALSRLDRPFFLDFYANVLGERNSTNDGRYLLRLAAINGVLREKKQLITSKNLRHKVFTACAGIKSEIRFKTKFNATAGKLGNAITDLESNLLSYKDAVAMLPNKLSTYADPGQFLQLLRWCERGIVQDNAEESSPALYAETIRKLLILSDHPHKTIRTRVRAMLVHYAPLDLFEKLNEDLKTVKLLELEQLQHSLRIMAVLDARLAQLTDSQKIRYIKERERVPRQFFGEISKHQLPTRDYVLGRLLSIDPALFARLIHEFRADLQKEHIKPAQLYLRHLYHAYEPVKTLDDSTTRDLLEETLCGWACSTHLPLRRMVTATLLKTNPERLVHAKTACFSSLKTWDHASVNELADCFMAAIKQIETNPNRAKIVADEYQKQHKHSIYTPVAKSIHLRVIPTTKKVAEFLSSRDPQLFLTELAGAMQKKANSQRPNRLEEVILLGDMALEKHKMLTKACMTRVIESLKKTLSPGDEDQSLLCLRYILELNGEITPEAVAAHSAGVRKLYELKKGGQN